MLSVGDIAPDFTGEDCQGRAVRLADFRGQRVVLFFFPRTFTTLCTVEARAFRDNYEKIRGLGAELIGVSTDTHNTQCEFASKEEISFFLLGDERLTISRSFEVLWPMTHRDRRVTFIIGADGKIEAVIHHELRVWRHLDDVLEHLSK